MKHIFLIVVLSSIFVSCDKEETQPNGLKFTFSAEDGEPRSFSTDAHLDISVGDACIADGAVDTKFERSFDINSLPFDVVIDVPSELKTGNCESSLFAWIYDHEGTDFVAVDMAKVFAQTISNEDLNVIMSE